MGLKLEYPAGATPLDADDAEGLIPTHISTLGQLNEWEYANVARGEAWVFGLRRQQILTIDFLQELHGRMFGDTWTWAGQIRIKATLPVGAAPEQIRPQLLALLGDVHYQIEHRTWSIEEITARFHHRLVHIHPFPNGNGRFARTLSDLLLHRLGAWVASYSAGAPISANRERRVEGTSLPCKRQIATTMRHCSSFWASVSLTDEPRTKSARRPTCCAGGKSTMWPEANRLKNTSMSEPQPRRDATSTCYVPR